MQKFNYFIMALFVTFLLAIKVDKISAIDFSSVGSSNIGDFDSCGEWNGCIGQTGYRFTIIRSYKAENGGLSYSQVYGTNSFVDEYHNYSPINLDSEIKQGGNLFNSILKSAGIAKETFLNNGYMIMAEPYFKIIYDTNSSYKGVAHDVAYHILNNLIKNNDALFQTYTGFWSVNQLIPCTAYIPYAGSSLDNYCRETSNNNHKKDYLTMAINNSRYGKWIIKASEIKKPPAPVIPKYSLTIYKKEGNSTKQGVTFTISGNGIKTTSCTTNFSGYCVINDLPAGSYTVTETVPKGYDAGQITCSGCSSINKNKLSVSISGNKSITVTNKKTCQSEFDALDNKRDKVKRIALYQKYGFKNLLNFDNTSNPCATSLQWNNIINMGCLSANTSNDSKFGPNNLSSYTETIKVNGITGYCRPTFTLSNTLTNKSVYSFGNGFTAGQMVLNKSESQRVIAKGTIQKTCYVYGSNLGSTVTDEKNVYYSDYITNLQFNGEKLDTVNLINSAWTKVNINGGALYTKNLNASYRLNPVYAKLGSGELSKYADSTNKNSIFLGYGFASKLDDKPNIKIDVPFSVDINMKGTTVGSSKYKCSYTVKNSEIIPGTPGNGDLNIEFRIIDTNNAFPGKSALGRNVGENWRAKSFDLNKNGIVNTKDLEILSAQMVLGGEGNLSYDLNKDGVVNYKDYNILAWANRNKTSPLELVGADKSSENALIRYIMNNTNNSYDKNKTGPIYKIKLTPDTIKKVRKYNESRNYDDYTLKCSDGGVNCKSTFLTQFGIKRLK